MSRENNMLPIKAELTVKVFDKNNNLIKEIHQDADPLVKNASKVLFCFLAGTSSSVLREDGVERFISLSPSSFYTSGSRWNYFYIYWRHKIAVGKSDLAVGYDDYALKNKYAETTSLSFTPLTHFDTYSQFVVSGTVFCSDAVTIKEVGLFGRFYKSIGFEDTEDVTYLVARDVLATPIDVPAGGNVVVTYTFKLGLPP